MPPRKRGASTKFTDDNDSPQSSKRVKTSSSFTAAPSEKKLVDGDGNPYWEASREYPTKFLHQQELGEDSSDFGITIPPS